MVSTDNHIPENLLLKIFLPQSAKFLLQLRCVCKVWDQFITSNFFIKSYLAHQKTSSNPVIYLLLDYGTSCSVCVIDLVSYKHVLRYHKYNMHDVCGRDSAGDRFKAYGICDGLLCLSHDKYDLYAESPIFLWNPIFRKGKKLPPIGTDLWYNGHSCLCFGYHDDDYKVVKVVPCLLKYDVYIYSLSTNSWKLSEFRMNDNASAYAGDTFAIYPKARLVNGVAYFVVKFNSRIASFDLSSGQIRQINLPSDFSFGGDFLMEEYRKSIALFGYNRRVIEMWVLRVNDNCFAWDKTFAMEIKHYYQPMGFVNNDILVIRFAGEYILYSVENDFRLRFRIPVAQTEKEKAIGIPKGQTENEKAKKQIRPLRINGLTESLVLLAETTTLGKNGGRS